MNFELLETIGSFEVWDNVRIIYVFLFQQKLLSITHV